MACIPETPVAQPKHGILKGKIDSKNFLSSNSTPLRTFAHETIIKAPVTTEERPQEAFEGFKSSNT
eukprot:1168530-Pyramimonas_sp.AAC.1